MEEDEQDDHEEEEQAGALSGAMGDSSEGGAFGSMPTEEQLPGMQTSKPRQ